MEMEAAVGGVLDANWLCRPCTGYQTQAILSNEGLGCFELFGGSRHLLFMVRGPWV